LGLGLGAGVLGRGGGYVVGSGLGSTPGRVVGSGLGSGTAVGSGDDQSDNNDDPGHRIRTVDCFGKNPCSGPIEIKTIAKARTD